MTLRAHFQPQASRRDRDTMADGSFWSYSYNSRGEVTFGNKNLPTSVPAIGRRVGYSYDPIGNRKQTTVNTRVATYTANALNQYDQRTVPPVVDVLGSAAPGAVVTATSPDGTVTALRQGGDFAAEVPVVNKVSGQPAPRYPTIEIKGRVNEVSGQNAVTDTASIQSGKHFLAGDPEAFAYDEDGNLTDDGRWHYTWDGENRLIAVETRAGAVAAGVPRTRIEYAYDGRGRRLRQTVRSGWTGRAYTQAVARRFLYDTGWNVLAEIDEAGAVVRRCLWGLDVSGSRVGAGGIGGLLVESLPATPGGALTDCFPFYDGNGNITGLLDAVGTEVARYEYGPFGETLRQSGPLAAANPWRWSTKWTEEATGLKDYGYRWLGDGRWLNRDPIGEDGGANLYTFGDNTPLIRWDYLGLSTITLTLERTRTGRFGTYGTLKVDIDDEKLKCCGFPQRYKTIETAEGAGTTLGRPGDHTPYLYEENSWGSGRGKDGTGMTHVTTDKDGNEREETNKGFTSLRGKYLTGVWNRYWSSTSGQIPTKPNGMAEADYDTVTNSELALNNGSGINLHFGPNSNHTTGCVLIGTSYTQTNTPPFGGRFSDEVRTYDKQKPYPYWHPGFQLQDSIDAHFRLYSAVVCAQHHGAKLRYKVNKVPPFDSKREGKLLVPNPAGTIPINY